MIKTMESLTNPDIDYTLFQHSLGYFTENRLYIKHLGIDTIYSEPKSHF